ncbi:MAG: FAD-dependent oxidoreductase [Gammaproteobacteria bacterium]
MSLLKPEDADFAMHVAVAVVGGGGCGLTAALSAAEAGASALVLEADAQALGTTSMSTGLIPAAGTRFQREAGIDDSPEQFAHDILAKTGHTTDAEIALSLAQASADTVEWLADSQGVPLSLVDSFLYPGHTVMRMHGSPNRTGGELMGALSNAVERAGVDVLTEARVSAIFAQDDGQVRGVRCARPDGSTEDLSCDALILACCGFAGNPEMVAHYIPEIVNADFFGHPGNKGDAIVWGRELGAAIEDIHSYQGHGGLAAGHGVPILWPVIMEGGFQMNQRGERFANEARGYSEHAVEVVAQPGHEAWTVYDQRLHEMMQEFDDYRDAMAQSAVRSADSVAGLADITGVPLDALTQTLTQVAAATRGETPDPLDREFADRAVLTAPYYTVKVHGALFHTQGGLKVDADGRVVREDGSLFNNLYAGGGAARGISGPGCSGYLAGNGLLTATTFGRLAGQSAGRRFADG